MPITLPNGKYRVQIRVKGHPRIDQVFDSKRQAEEFEKAERERIERSTPLYTLEMTLREAWTAYRGSMLFRAKQETTQRTEESRIGRALKSLGAYSLAQLVDGQVIARFRDQLGGERVKVMVRKKDDPDAPEAAKTPKGTKAKKAAKPKDKKPELVPGHRRDGDPQGFLSNDAQRLIMAAVSSVMLWAVEQRLMVYNPVRGLKKPKPGERDRRMERDEEFNLFVLAKNPKIAHERLAEDARFVALQRELGCRPGELRKLRRDDVDVEARAVRFRDTKNGDTRIVHAVREAHGLLGAQLVQAEAQAPDSPYLFTSRSAEDGSPVPFCYTAAIRRLRKANIVGNDFHAHAARREFASGAFEAGLPIEDIRKQTGHRSVKALEAYNKSDALHPDARKRVEEAGRRRAEERFEDLAAALGVSVDQLRKFQLERQVTELRVVREAAGKAPSKIVSPLRKPVSRVLPKGAKKLATAK